MRDTDATLTTKAPSHSPNSLTGKATQKIRSGAVRILLSCQMCVFGCDRRSYPLLRDGIVSEHTHGVLSLLAPKGNTLVDQFSEGS